MEKTVEERLFKVIQEVLNSHNKRDNAEIKLTDNLKDDLGFDSIEMVDLVVMIEDEFGVDIFESGVINTVQEVLNLCK